MKKIIFLVLCFCSFYSLGKVGLGAHAVSDNVNTGVYAMLGQEKIPDTIGYFKEEKEYEFWVFVDGKKKEWMLRDSVLPSDFLNFVKGIFPYMYHSVSIINGVWCYSKDDAPNAFNIGGVVIENSVGTFKLVSIINNIRRYRFSYIQSIYDFVINDWTVDSKSDTKDIELSELDIPRKFLDLDITKGYYAVVNGHWDSCDIVTNKKEIKKQYYIEKVFLRFDGADPNNKMWQCPVVYFNLDVPLDRILRINGKYEIYYIPAYVPKEDWWPDWTIWDSLFMKKKKTTVSYEVKYTDKVERIAGGLSFQIYKHDAIQYGLFEINTPSDGIVEFQYRVYLPEFKDTRMLMNNWEIFTADYEYEGIIYHAIDFKEGGNTQGIVDSSEKLIWDYILDIIKFLFTKPLGIIITFSIILLFIFLKIKKKDD